MTPSSPPAPRNRTRRRRQESAFSSWFAMGQPLSFQDRLGGAAQLRIDDDRTFVSAIATGTSD